MTKDELAEQHMNIAVHIAKKYTASYSDLDELIFVAIDGLAIAVIAYKPERNVPFSAYANKVIHNELRQFLRVVRQSVGAIAIEGVETIESEDNTEESIVETELHQKVRREIERLAEPRRTITFLWMNGKTTRDIAKIFGLSQGRISQLLISAQGKLKKRLGGYYV